MAVGEVFFSEAFKKLKVLPPPKISVGVKSTGNWLELNVDAGELTGQDLARLLSEYSRKKKYYRLKSGEFVNLEDNGLITIAKLVEGLGLNPGELENKNFRLPKYRLYIWMVFLKKKAA